jgi:hypothetical protein
MISRLGLAANRRPVRLSRKLPSHFVTTCAGHRRREPESIPPKSFWKIGINQRLDRFPQFEDSVQFLHIGGLGQTVREIVPSLLEGVQEKLGHRIVPSLRLGPPIHGPARLGSRGDSGLETLDVGTLSLRTGQCQ